MKTPIAISQVGNVITVILPTFKKIVYLDYLNPQHLKLTKFLLGLSVNSDLHLDGEINVTVENETAMLLVYVYYW